MNARTVCRAGLALLSVTALPIGVWGIVGPRSFYDDFPGFGRHWVSPDGPFNEHLVRDFAALNLALAVFTLCAAIWVSRPIVIAAALAWLVYQVPHLAYHALNREHFDTGDQVGILAGLALTPVLAVLVLVAQRGLPAERAP